MGLSTRTPKSSARAISAESTLSIIKKEMAKPQVVESAHSNADTLANGGHILPTKTPIPRRRVVSPIKGKKLKSMLATVPGWKLAKEQRIVRKFDFPDFRTALSFVVKIGEIAEAQGHHPDILLGWGKVQATTWTHDVHGLSESDFVLAAKISAIPR